MAGKRKPYVRNVAIGALAGYGYQVLGKNTAQAKAPMWGALAGAVVTMMLPAPKKRG